ncbi:uncharacterized protein EI90DRAFT_2598059 [Cantharellus anzutake]|uniref:uncharacterized protein n=1 Tax=Cantharellus anzutake TaxID=1750568 RepID=UPI001904AD09|nr:uncharacterized protein EI90DRAFT_2598059 [Cantharellus anzutake]KAF8320524.1 hypothetical protein EI90DRAFT_2598059 [Cantharellus anzutake]
MAALRRKRSNAILKEPSKDAEKRTSVSALDQRIQQEVMKLTGVGFSLDLATGVPNSIDVNFSGPKGTPYEGGVWIYHPNIDDLSGDATGIIREFWSPMHDLSIIFQDTLPALLRSPKANTAVNHEALDLYRTDDFEYASIVKGTHHCLHSLILSPYQTHILSLYHTFPVSFSAIFRPGPPTQRLIL